VRLAQLFALLFLCLFFISQASAQVTSDREALRGLNGVGVFYKIEPSKLKDAGLDLAEISSEVKLRLEKAGIRILETEAEKKQVAGYPHLQCGISVSGVENHRVSFLITVSVLQFVYLARQSKGEALYLTTWNKGTVHGDADLDALPETVRTLLGDELDQFINDYRAVNPKP
jgi:hypothetical protein